MKEPLVDFRSLLGASLLPAEEDALVVRKPFRSWKGGKSKQFINLDGAKRTWTAASVKRVMVERVGVR